MISSLLFLVYVTIIFSPLATKPPLIYYLLTIFKQVAKSLKYLYFTKVIPRIFSPVANGITFENVTPPLLFSYEVPVLFMVGEVGGEFGLAITGVVFWLDVLIEYEVEDERFIPFIVLLLGM